MKPVTGRTFYFFFFFSFLFFSQCHLNYFSVPSCLKCAANRKPGWQQLLLLLRTAAWFWRILIKGDRNQPIPHLTRPCLYYLNKVIMINSHGQYSHHPEDCIFTNMSPCLKEFVRYYRQQTDKQSVRKWWQNSNFHNGQYTCCLWAVWLFSCLLIYWPWSPGRRIKEHLKEDKETDLI